jgi:DNA-binding NtrC family response regulator
MELFMKKEPLVQLSSQEFDKIKFRARVAFIDDEEVPYIKRLQNDGYMITPFPDIDNMDDFIRKNYHVVILDIQGIGKSLSPNQEGWGLLKYLKEECPNIVVIMYTGADWSITQYKYLADKADAFIGKDLEFLDFKSKLDSGIRKAFSYDYHFEIARKQITKGVYQSSTIEEIKRIIDSYGSNETKANKLLKKVIKNQDTLKVVNHFLSIAGGIIKLKTGI